MKFRTNQTGAAHIVAVLLVILIVTIGVVGWKVWDNSKNKSSNNNAATSQSGTQQATSNESTDSNKKYLQITQLGVQFEIPSEVPDLKVDSFTEYPAEGNTAASAVAVLNSPALEAEGKIKTTGTQERHEKLGEIVRQKSNSIYYGNTTIEDYAVDSNFAGVKIGDYYYVYVTTYAADNAAVYLSAIKKSIESTLKSIN